LHTNNSAILPSGCYRLYNTYVGRTDGRTYVQNEKSKNVQFNFSRVCGALAAPLDIVYYCYLLLTTDLDDPVYSDPSSSFEKQTTAQLTTISTTTTARKKADTQSKLTEGNFHLLSVCTTVGRLISLFTSYNVCIQSIEFEAKPRNLPFIAEFSYFQGISQNLRNKW